MGGWKDKNTREVDVRVLLQQCIISSFRCLSPEPQDRNRSAELSSLCWQRERPGIANLHSEEALSKVERSCLEQPEYSRGPSAGQSVKTSDRRIIFRQRRKRSASRIGGKGVAGILIDLGTLQSLNYPTGNRPQPRRSSVKVSS